MPGNDNAPLGAGGVNQTLAAGGMLAPLSLPPNNLPAYVVLLVTRTGMPRRRVYLDLGAARTAVAKAHAKDQPAELVLCKSTAVTADLDDDGEVTE